MKRALTFLKHEFLKMLPPTIYFFVVLHMILFARNLLAGEWGIDGVSSALATIGSLIIGKSILIVDALPLFSRLGKKRLIYDIVARSALYVVIAMALQFLEEVIPLLVKHEGLSGASAQVASGIDWPQFWVRHMIMVMSLLFYTSITGVMRVIGHQTVLATLMNPVPGRVESGTSVPH